jgi:hypothetical protein
MILNEIIWHFQLGSVDDPRIIPFLKRTLPGILLTARGDAAEYYEYKNPVLLSQDMIERFLKKHRDYDAVEVSKIVVNWRKEYGTNE